MTDVLLVIAFAVSGYLLGSINVSIIVSNLAYRSDVRKYGSGNAGATNMARVYGLAGGIITLVCDFLKCIAAMLPAYLVGRTVGGADLAEYCKVAAGAACLLGHAFPLYFKFKGGKGISVGAALALMVEWRILLIILGVFILVFVISRIVSLSSLCAALAFIVSAMIIYVFQGGTAYLTLWELVISIAAPIFVIWLHRSNIVKLLRGEEKKFTYKKQNKE